MRRILTLMIAPVACLALAGIAHAEPLTEAQVAGYAASIGEVEQLVNDREAEGVITWDEDGFEPKAGEQWNPMSRVAAKITGMPLYKDFMKIIESHGFESAEQWGAVGDRVTRAMIAVQVRDENPDLQAEMASTLAEIDNNPDLTAEQKQMMRGSMEHAFAVLKTMSDAPEEDIQAVRPHMDALEAAMNVDE